MAGWNDFYVDDNMLSNVDADMLENILNMGPQTHRPVYRGRKKDDESTSKTSELYRTVEGNPVRTVYITRIPAMAVWNDVHRVFIEFGPIKKLFLKTGANGPFAFVTYESPDSALKALNQRCVYILESKVYINMADSWHQPVENSDGTVDWTKQKRKRTDMEEDGDGDDEYEEEETEDEEKAEIVQGHCVEVCSVEDKNSIDILNDDCLSHIFSFLSFEQMLRIERVCKRWQAVNLNLWRRVHTLDFTSDLLLDVPMNLVTLECLLKRTNDNLKVLNLCRKSNSLCSNSLLIISRYCKNLEQLYISNMPINNRSLPHLGKYCPKLKKIVFDECKHFADKDLYKWFSVSTALTSVTITHARGIVGTALTAFKAPLEHLDLNYCVNLIPSLLIECLKQNSATMKELSLNSCIGLRGNDVGRIVEAVPNLCSLSLNQTFPLLNNTSLTSIGSLANLTHLNLTHNRSVSDYVIAAIVDGCKELSCLNLSGPGRSDEDFPFTEGGLAKLGKLRKLINLDISYLDQTSDECLKNFTAKSTCLRVLKCLGCPKLSDVGCTQVVSLCNDLELFDLSGNELVTNETIKTALNSVKLRTHRRTLELVIGGTSVNLDCIKIDDLRLAINRRNFCKVHLRPDFVDNLFFPPSDDEEELEILCHEIDDGGEEEEEDDEDDDDDDDDEDYDDEDDDDEDDDDDVYDDFIKYDVYSTEDSDL